MPKSTVNIEFNLRGGGNLSEIKGFNPYEHVKTFINNRFTLFKNTIKNPAFTLAETLITIGMIGVIAALTLPTLMNSTNDKEVVARVKKTYAMVNEALSRAVAKYGPVDTWYQSSDSTDALKSQRLGKRITEFMQVEKVCGLETGKGCFASGPSLDLTGATGPFDFDNDSKLYKVILSDGTSLGTSFGSVHSIFYFDIDGPKKGRNVTGIDLFFQGIDMKKSTLKRGSNYSYPGACRSPGMAEYCTDWILRYDNIDYKLIDDSGFCPNGTKLSDTNPTCN